MELYTSEVGNTKGISTKKPIDNKVPYVYYNGEEYVISASFVSFLESDKKTLLDNYECFVNIYGELKDCYNRKDYKALEKFITMVLNGRNFYFTISSKPFLFAKILYICIHGRNNYSCAGNATLFISDIARLKEDFVYLLLNASNNPSNANFKKLLELLRDCPCYYLSDERNTFKEDVTKLLWRKNFSIYEKQFYDLDLGNPESFNQLFTLIQVACLISRWNTTTENEEFKTNKITMYHSDKYKYNQQKLLEMGVPYFNIKYTKVEKEPILQLIEDINFIAHAEFTKMIDIFRNNGDYRNDHFKFVASLFNTVTQLNCEFQLPINELASLMGVMDLVRDEVGEYYHQSHVVDYLIVSHYTRLSEYLKNHGEEKNATKVFKTRV